MIADSVVATTMIVVEILEDLGCSCFSDVRFFVFIFMLIFSVLACNSAGAAEGTLLLRRTHPVGLSDIPCWVDPLSTPCWV